MCFFLQLYNNKMGGVDLSDQRRAYYEIHEKTVRYWKYYLWGLFEFAINNAFVLFHQVWDYKFVNNILAQFSFLISVKNTKTY